jgi:hypothetical protein
MRVKIFYCVKNNPLYFLFASFRPLWYIKTAKGLACQKKKKNNPVDRPAFFTALFLRVLITWRGFRNGDRAF